MSAPLPITAYRLQPPTLMQRFSGGLREKGAQTKWLIGLCIAVALLSSAWLFRGTFDRHEGTAAWVQAVGSIAIIAATAWSANRQFRESKERDRKARHEFRVGIASLARSCMDAFDGFLSKMPPSGIAISQEQFSEAYVPTDFDIPIEGLAAVPLHQLGDARLITAVLMLRGAMSRIKRDLDNAVRNPSFPRHLHEIRNQRTLIFNALANVVRLVDGYSAEDELSKIAGRA